MVLLCDRHTDGGESLTSLLFASFLGGKQRLPVLAKYLPRSEMQLSLGLGHGRNVGLAGLFFYRLIQYCWPRTTLLVIVCICFFARKH